MQIINRNQISRTALTEFVKKHPNGNVFQTPQMYDVYLNTPKYEPVFWAVADEKNNILATLLAVICKEHSGLLGMFTARAIVWGGPLIKDDDPLVLEFILQQYENEMKSRAIYTQFRNLWDCSENKELYAKNKFVYENHLDILVDVSKEEDELWQKVNRKGRNKIRQAYKKDVTVTVKNSNTALEKCFDILSDVYSHAKLPLPDLNFFRSLYNYLSEDTKFLIFTAQHNGEIIGCRLVLSYQDILYDFYAGSYYNCRDKFPNDLLPWEIFLWAKKNNYTVFDFGGAGKPNVPYGARDYKMKFGGELVNWGRFEKIHKPFLMKIGKLGLRFYKGTYGLFKKSRAQAG